MPLIAFISDVHANRVALDAVLQDMARFSPQRTYNLGDIVGYGPDPRGCLAWAREHAAVSLLGNHDAAVAGLIALEWFNPWARAAVEWTAQQLTIDERLWLKGRPHHHRIEEPGQLRLLLVHGTPRQPVTEYIDADSAREVLREPDFDVCLVGHTHLMGLYTRSGYRPFYESTELELTPPCILNVGSVGQPRDGVPEAGYVLIDPEARRLVVRRIAYDVQAAQQAILQAGLPWTLAERLAYGR